MQHTRKRTNEAGLAIEATEQNKHCGANKQTIVDNIYVRVLLEFIELFDTMRNTKYTKLEKNRKCDANGIETILERCEATRADQQKKRKNNEIKLFFFR
jgi:hypothetical protein